MQACRSYQITRLSTKWGVGKLKLILFLVAPFGTCNNGLKFKTWITPLLARRQYGGNKLMEGISDEN